MRRYIDFIFNKNTKYIDDNNSIQLQPLLSPQLPKPKNVLMRSKNLTFAKGKDFIDNMENYIPRKTIDKAQKKVSSYSILLKENLINIFNLSKKTAVSMYNKSIDIFNYIQNKYNQNINYQNLQIIDNISLQSINEISSIYTNISTNLDSKNLIQILKESKDSDSCDEKSNYIQALKKVCIEYLTLQNPQQPVVAKLIKEFRQVDAKNKYKNYNDFLRKSILDIVQNKNPNEPVLNLLLNQINRYHIPLMLSIEVDSYGEYDKFHEHKHKLFLKKILNDYIVNKQENIDSHTINKILSNLKVEHSNDMEFVSYLDFIKSRHSQNTNIINILEAFPHSN